MKKQCSHKFHLIKVFRIQEWLKIELDDKDLYAWFVCENCGLTKKVKTWKE
jgi:hypothetical protein